jgi:hypothetical protein
MFRYDQVILVDEVANPDYEALHLRFINVGFNNFQQNTFDVRVGASLVGKQGFSQFPKIEFPLLENGEKPFNSWYEESQDDSGPKFEIRFALTNRSFDLKVWDSLSNEDKSMLTVFLIYLPNHLKRVRREIQLDKRSWDEWDQFAVETSNVFKDFLSNQSAFAKGMLENEFGSKLKNKDKVEEIKKYGVASKKRSRKNIK